jgi:ferredoxin-type protein NapH
MQKSLNSKINISGAISALISDVRKTGAVWPFAITFLFLSAIRMNVSMQMLVADRFSQGTGWIEIAMVSVYAAWVFMHMKDPRKVAQWRKGTWLLFTAIFFSQLILGLVADKRFLMTGNLHLPVPAVILAGPLYRMQLSFMPLLFLSTVLITGPAWCSHLCYFGSLDNWAASGKKLRNKPIKNKKLIKHTFLFLFILVALLFNVMGVSNLVATLSGLSAGVLGLAIIFFISRRKNKMFHCTQYCPVGTMVNYLRFVSPFRMRISDSCTTCMACTLKCRYDALNLENIKQRKPGMTCTYCGECLSACHQQSIQYRFLWLRPEAARNLYLILTISLHASFLVLARI